MWRIFLFPFALLFEIVILLRHWLFDLKILKSIEFSMPVISVGNLTMGGSGKTPHIEYLINLLLPENNIAVLSRGYGRKTNNFIVANQYSTSDDIGDVLRCHHTAYRRQLGSLLHQALFDVELQCLRFNG